MGVDAGTISVAPQVMRATEAGLQAAQPYTAVVNENVKSSDDPFLQVLTWETHLSSQQLGGRDRRIASVWPLWKTKAELRKLSLKGGLGGKTVVKEHALKIT